MLNIVWVYQGPAFNVSPGSLADSSLEFCFVFLSPPMCAHWLQMCTVIYRTQGTLPLPPQVEDHLMSWREVAALKKGWTGWPQKKWLQLHCMSNSKASSPLYLTIVADLCLVPCQERGLSLFFLPLRVPGSQLRYHCIYTQARKQPSAGNYSDLLINFGELEQAASRLCLPRATTHAEAAPNIYLGNIYCSWNWWRIS